MRKLVLSSFLNPINDKKCDYIAQGAMVIKTSKSTGVSKVEFLGSIDKAAALYGEFAEVIDLRGKVVLPGFFDMHFHWVQDDVREMPKDSLLTWLEKYTFPAENKFKDKKYAKEKAQKFFSKLTKNGTLGGACYSSIHPHALEYAFKYANGDFIIGNVLMTMNSPNYLSQTKKNALNSVAKLSEKYKDKYALTPRFAIATDPETMLQSTKLAKRNKSFMQTHLSETKNEIDFVMSIYKEMKGFEKVESYTEIYKKVGMLGPRSIMGHGIHLDQSELALLSSTKTSLAHCPTSNAPHKELGLGSGLFDFKKTERAGVRWALASDIGGGPFVSMFDVMRSFVAQNKKAKVKGATYVKALNRSTNAGAEILKLQSKRGNFGVGKQANFIAVDLPRLAVNNKLKAEDILEIIVNSCKNNRSNYQNLVKDVYINGEKLID